MIRILSYFSNDSQEYARVDNELKQITDPLKREEALRHKLVAERQDHQRTRDRVVEEKAEKEKYFKESVAAQKDRVSRKFSFVLWNHYLKKKFELVE